MNTCRRWGTLLLVALLVGAPAARPAGAGALTNQSDNVTLIKNFPTGRTGDITYDGRYVYAISTGAQGGLHVIDPRSLKQLAFFPCPGWSDVKALKRGLIAYDASPGCAGLSTYGVALLDTKNPKRIKVLDAIESDHHTFRNYPGKRYVYLSPNGCCGDFNRGTEYILDATNPRDLKIGGEFVSDGLGCHDVWIHSSKRKKIAACAGGSETQLWDVADPLKPKMLSRIPTPQIFFNHSAAISSDGNLLVAGDEAHLLTECAGGPLGDIWIYDISDPVNPVLKSTFTLTRGTPVSSFWANSNNQWCSVHNYEFIPRTHTLVTGWYAGGMNVLDLSDPANPKELAYYQEPGLSAWGAYFIEGRVWTSDFMNRDRGIDVFEVAGL